ncbi:hypothetical protein HDR58_10550 [bacterium]|nr:hypothetical protein [bacterium]
MKKILLTAFVFSCAVGVVTAATYSNTYSQNLEKCNPYIEKFKVQIPTEDPNTPVLHLQSTETIMGWREGKCVTKSMVFSEDLNQNIIETKCAFSKNQVDSIVKKTNAANKGDDKAAKNLQEELTGYAQDSATCQVNNLLKED